MSKYLDQLTKTIASGEHTVVIVPRPNNRALQQIRDSLEKYFARDGLPYTRTSDSMCFDNGVKVRFYSTGTRKYDKLRGIVGYVMPVDRYDEELSLVHYKWMKSLGE